MICFRISIYFNVKLIVQPKILHFEALNIENGFHIHRSGKLHGEERND